MTDSNPVTQVLAGNMYRQLNEDTTSTEIFGGVRLWRQGS